MGMVILSGPSQEPSYPAEPRADSISTLPLVSDAILPDRADSMSRVGSHSPRRAAGFVTAISNMSYDMNHSEHDRRLIPVLEELEAGL